MMTRCKKIAASLLILAMVLVMMPFTGMKADAATKIQVTVKYDASAVAADLTALHSDMATNGLIESTETVMPKSVTVTVNKGATVQTILAAAQKKTGCYIEGLSNGYVTEVGFISSENLSKLTSIAVGDYSTGNIFAGAGWYYSVNGTDLAEGIDAAKVTTNGAVVTGTYHLVAAWDSTNNCMAYYDTDFTSSYASLVAKINRAVTLTSFTDTEKTAYETALAQGKTAQQTAYTSAVLTKDFTSTTTGGYWIGLFETLGTSLYGDGSATETLQAVEKNLATALAPQDTLDAATKKSVKATGIKSVTATRQTNKATLTWKKSTTCKMDGYEIYRATRKGGTYTKVATVKTMKYTMTKKSSNKTNWYVKIRGYRTVNGVKVYTGFSTIKVIK